MGFCTHRPTAIPHAHRSRHPTAFAVLQFLLRHRARRRGPCHPQPSCYQHRCRVLVVRATGALPSRRTTPAVKVHAPAPLSPALYHVLPRTSPFSNINICSVFPASTHSASITRSAVSLPQRRAPPAATLSRSMSHTHAPPRPSVQGIGFPSQLATHIATFSNQPCADSWERVEGVSRSLPYSDLLALTSSHMFVSVMN
jgi:hypothetical protein